MRVNKPLSYENFSLAKYISKKPFPIVTVVFLVLTGFITSLQFFYPDIIFLLYRNPQALLAGEWWRLITPIFIHPEGWIQIIFDFVALALVGIVVEYLFGKIRWIILYLSGGFIGHLAGYFWQPYSAGSSVATAGLLGGLLICVILRRRNLPIQVYIWGYIGLVFAVIITAFQNIHGPPIITGALIALLMSWKE